MDLSDYRDSDAKNRRKDLLYQSSSTSLKLSTECLMEEIKPVVMEKYELEIELNQKYYHS